MLEGDKYYPGFTNRKKGSGGIFLKGVSETGDGTVRKGTCAVVTAVCAGIPVLAVNGTAQAPQPIAMGLLNLPQPLCG